MAAGIIFIVIIQRKIPLGKLWQFRLEAAKSLLASSMWLWLFLDSLFAHMHRDPYYRDTVPRVIRAGITGIVLWYNPFFAQTLQPLPNRRDNHLLNGRNYEE
jgi:hypothetical protein